MRGGAHGRWQRDGDALAARIAVSPAWLPLAREHALHRLRAARAKPRGVLHPTDVEVTPELLTVCFAPGALDRDDAQEETFGCWRDRTLVPCLDVLASCLLAGATGFAPIMPVAGRWALPPSWLLLAVATPPTAAQTSSWRRAGWRKRSRAARRFATPAIAASWSRCSAPSGARTCKR